MRELEKESAHGGSLEGLIWAGSPARGVSDSTKALPEGVISQETESCPGELSRIAVQDSCSGEPPRARAGQGQAGPWPSRRISHHRRSARRGEMGWQGTKGTSGSKTASLASLGTRSPHFQPVSCHINSDLRHIPRTAGRRPDNFLAVAPNGSAATPSGMVGTFLFGAVSHDEA